MTDGMWDSDVESDNEDFVLKHHVRNNQINFRSVLSGVSIYICTEETERSEFEFDDLHKAMGQTQQGRC